MRRPPSVVLAAAAYLAVAVYAQRTRVVAAVNSTYTGSEACRSCHEPEYESWRKNLHVQMTRPIADATVAGDFRPGTTLQDHGRSYSMERRDGRYFITVTKGARPAERFEVNYTLGARRFQGYLSKLPDGRIYVLPVFWHNETKRWIDYEEITPLPKDTDHELRQIWNVSCVNCHATNLVRNYDVSTNTFKTTWTEMGVGCEACHGPGRAHIDDPEHLAIFTMKKVPTRQIFDACGYCHGNKNNVFFGFKPGDRYDDYALPFLISQPIPDNDPQGDFWPDGRPSRFNRPQALAESGCFRSGEATCTSCHRMHGSENNHSLKEAIDEPGGGHSVESDRLCTQCHTTGGDGAGGARGAGRAGEAGGSSGSAGSTGSSALAAPKLEEEQMSEVDESRRPATFADHAAHTHHAPDSQGSRCINCHMSDVNWRLITRRLDHTFKPPVPEMTAAYGVPNACTSCHEDRSPEWAAATMDRWYGNAARRRAVVRVADIMYRAGSGDIGVLPDVARLAVTRSQGALVRASSAEFAGQLISRARGTVSPKLGSMAASEGGRLVTPAIVNALIGAASDPEPWIRIAAVRSLGLLDGEPRVASAIAAHLIDPSRVARVSAAEALMNLGVTVLDGEVGRALAAAQDEWAESLRTFNDVAADHAALGWLQASRGMSEEGAKELRIAAALDPTDARTHVYLGAVAARGGQFQEALRQFETAKKLDPAYRNLDRLIDEVQKRITKRD